VKFAALFVKADPEPPLLMEDIVPGPTLRSLQHPLWKLSARGSIGVLAR